MNKKKSYWLWYKSKVRRILSGILWNTGILQYIGFDGIGEQTESRGKRIKFKWLIRMEKLEK